MTAPMDMPEMPYMEWWCPHLEQLTLDLDKPVRVRIAEPDFPAVCYIWVFPCGCFYIGESINFAKRVQKTIDYSFAGYGRKGPFSEHTSPELAGHIRFYGALVIEGELWPRVLKRFRTKEEGEDYERRKIREVDEDRAQRMMNTEHRTYWQRGYARCPDVDWRVLDLSREHTYEDLRLSSSNREGRGFPGNFGGG